MSNEFFEEVNRLMVVTPDPVIEYRLHYNEHGDIYSCTMLDHPADTQYIVADKDTYDLFHRYRVIDGKLVLIPIDDGLQRPLIKSTRGFAVVKNNAALLLENEEYNDTEYYDKRNY